MRRTNPQKQDMKALTQLVERHLSQKGWKLKELAVAINPHNPNKTLRKILKVLEREGFDLDRRNCMIQTVARTLHISDAPLDAALEEDRQELWRQIGEAQRRSFKGPYIWIEVTPDWHPCLVSITGPNIYRKLSVPASLDVLKDEKDIIRVAGEFIAEHFRSGDLRVPQQQVTHYLYRKEFELGYRFTPDGKFVEKEIGIYFAPVWGVRIR